MTAYFTNLMIFLRELCKYEYVCVWCGGGVVVVQKLISYLMAGLFARVLASNDARGLWKYVRACMVRCGVWCGGTDNTFRRTY